MSPRSPTATISVPQVAWAAAISATIGRRARGCSALRATPKAATSAGTKSSRRWEPGFRRPWTSTRRFRGKLGFAWDRSLIYATGGAAFGDVTTGYQAPIGTSVGRPNAIRVGWTGGAGFAYAFTTNWEGDVEYRYTDLGTQHHNFGGGITDNNEVNFNMIRVGLTYRFAPPPPPPPPAPMPAVAPAPPPPMMARTFLVFFDFDRYNLTPDARRVIDAAASTYKSGGHARIDVSGFTDLAGTQAYNLRLSQRRADAVAGYLMKQGVPKNVMDVKWFGKEHPRVPTPDGVREPQNRRVEIVMP